MAEATKTRGPTVGGVYWSSGEAASHRVWSLPAQATPLKRRPLFPAARPPQPRRCASSKPARTRNHRVRRRGSPSRHYGVRRHQRPGLARLGRLSSKFNGESFVLATAMNKAVWEYQCFGHGGVANRCAA